MKKASLPILKEPSLIASDFFFKLSEILVSEENSYFSFSLPHQVNFTADHLEDILNENVTLW